MNKFKQTLGGMPPSRRHDSLIPPPRSQDELRPSRPPKGLRTPSIGQLLPEVEELPSDAAPWMKRARRMVIAFERAIAGDDVSPGEIAALERAWGAYELGASDDVIARVAHLCERAHTAINQRLKGTAKEAYTSCAAVMYTGLPRSVRKLTSHDELLEIVKQLRGETDPWPAVIDATAKILRWDELARQHAGQAIRVALDAAQKSRR